ncbi:hypothetical protein [Parageobacillus thermoglucosidasius]|uniref:Uncharacterized protein n=1 Tax=Parageobacillus thermoglucosidasius TaxID=1426 RepID=A0AB38QV67_PARTM|nr:hypothetical protein [Parageobacillus thermoglucosidasius]UOE74985.1 hypothetical protein IMI45_11515 [Parageobacillus thermoglucosidasius]GCD82350.1 hypothetical protein PTHTG4_14120 [Parageobacillus thermoglucosidasius]
MKGTKRLRPVPSSLARALSMGILSSVIPDFRELFRFAEMFKAGIAVARKMMDLTL